MGARKKRGGGVTGKVHSIDVDSPLIYLSLAMYMLYISICTYFTYPSFYEDNLVFSFLYVQTDVHEHLLFF